MKKLKVLNLYGGLGGNRRDWKDVDVTMIESNEQIAAQYQLRFMNDEVIVDDAHKYLLKHHSEFDFIWGSPPCPSHSRINTDGQQKPRYPEMAMYQEIIFLGNNWFKGKWVIENVIPYYTPLIPPRANIGRHLYWSNFNIGDYPTEKTKSIKDQDSKPRYGFDVRGTDIKDKRKVLRNLVDPNIGNYILNCARNIITKQNVNQVDMFND